MVKKSMRKLLLLFLAFSAVIFSSVSFAQEDTSKINDDDISVPRGYKIEALIANLSVPTTAIFDEENNLYIAESGFLNTSKPRIIKITADYRAEVIASDGLIPPVTGLEIVEGKLYVSHKGKVSIVENGQLKDIVTGLPSSGDHQNNNLVLGSDGKIYMGQGTVTNTGVVGEDNHIFGWLESNPNLHETPCKDITLVGQNFESQNPLKEGSETVRTGAYQPFGKEARAGQIVKGNSKCGGSIVRFNPDGSEFELFAWGLRNPFGLEFDSSGQLWSTFHGADVRGSRPIFNDPDYLVKVDKDAWYGFPEYFNGVPASEMTYQPGDPKPEFLWRDHPSLSTAFTTFDSHAASNGIDFSESSEFGYNGDLFVAMFGSFAPATTGLNVEPSGFNISRVNMQTGEVEVFARNKLPGPAYLNGGGGLNRPSDVVFARDGSLYVIDWGAAFLDEEGLKLSPKTGVVWRIYTDDMEQLRSNGPLMIEVAATEREDIKPIVPNIPEVYRSLFNELAIVGGLFILLFSLLIFVNRLRKR
jgi:glucose/arabinose dehydrogenase